MTTQPLCRGASHRRRGEERRTPAQEGRFADYAPEHEAVLEPLLRLSMSALGVKLLARAAGRAPRTVAPPSRRSCQRPRRTRRRVVPGAAAPAVFGTGRLCQRTPRQQPDEREQVPHGEIRQRPPSTTTARWLRTENPDQVCEPCAEAGGPRRVGVRERSSSYSLTDAGAELLDRVVGTLATEARTGVST